MFRRAWKRTLAFSLAHPAKLIASNLGFFLLLLPPAVLMTGSRIFAWVSPGIAVPLAGLWSWVSAAWLVNAMRRRLNGEEGWIRWTPQWLKQSGLKHLFNALLWASGLFWVRVNIDFWSRVFEEEFWLKFPAMAITLSVGLWLVLAALVSLGLANGDGPGLWRRLKIYALVPLAWLPSCLASCLAVLFLSGLSALLIDAQHWSVRLLALPLFFAPVFTAAFAAGIVAGLDIEIRSVVLQRDVAEAKLPGLKELFRPWDL